EEMLVNIGTITDVGFYTGPPPEQCWKAFHYVDQATACALSRKWKQYPSGACSSYFAVSPNKRDIFTSGLTKPDQGSKPIGYINAVRIPGHALHYSLGWPEQGYNEKVFYKGQWFPADRFSYGENKTRSCMRSPYMSAPITWTTAH